MRRRSNSHSPISLFTFLDTLVCTMGSLILMLLAMTPKIKERAEARELARLAALSPVAAAAVSEAVSPVVSAAEDEEERARARERRRESWLNSAAQARAALAKKQADYHEQRQLLKTAAAQLKEIQDRNLEARLKVQSAADTSQTLSDLETKLENQEAAVAQKIAQTRKSLELLNRKQAAAANEYALVPYDGTSGTVRRPIYLECSKRGFRFLPEDETLSPLDLEGFRESYNPLLNGTQALLRFWSRRRRDSGGKEPEPYVLLLVRPSGCLNYYLARGFLSSLGANFGYELIEEDWKLSVPAADPLAKTVLRETLDITVQAHGQMKDELAEAAQRGPFGSGRTGGRSGGFGDASPSDDGDDLDGPSFGNGRSDRRPRVRLGPPTRGYRDSAGQGYGSAADENSAGNSGRGNSGTGNGSGIAQGTPAGRPGAGRPAGVGGGARPGDLSGRGAAGASGDEGSGPAGDGTNGATGGAFASRRSVGRDSAGGAGIGADAAAAGEGGATESPAGRPGGGLASGNGNRGGTNRRPGRPAARPASISGSSADDVSGEGGSDGDGPLELSPDDEPRQLPGGGSGSLGDNDFPLRSLPAGGGAQNGRRSRGTAGGDSSQGSGKSGANSDAKGSSTSAGTDSSRAPTGAGDSESGDAGIPGLDMGASGSDGSGGSPLQMGGPGANIRLGSKTKRQSTDKPDDDSDSGPRLGGDEGKTGGGKGRVLGPRLWGRARSKASIGLERKMEIRVLADKIMVGSKDFVVPVGRGEKVQEMIDHVVVGIDHVAEKWGEPPESFYWIPTVKFVVYPGGNLYYERLRGPLEQKWGVVSTVEYAPDPKPADRAGGGRP